MDSHSKKVVLCLFRVHRLRTFFIKLSVDVAIPSLTTTRNKCLYAILPVDKASICASTCSINTDKITCSYHSGRCSVAIQSVESSL